MRSETPARYSFRPVERADLGVIAQWLEAAHMREWWGDPRAALAEIEEAISCPATAALLLELDGRPIGYAQHYAPHLEKGHPYRDQPEGTLGLDMSIGPAELLGRGHGSAALRQLCDELFARGAPRLIIDPDPGNARAIRAYEKAGFAAFETRTTIYGPALMMARHPQRESAPA